MPLLGGTSELYLLKIWDLQHWAIYVRLLCVVVVYLLFHVVVVVHLSLCIHNYRWTTTKLHSNNNNNSKEINLHKLFNLFVLIILCCYCVIFFFFFFFLLFICNNRTPILHSSNNNSNNKRSIYINCSIFCSDLAVQQQITMNNSNITQ